MKHFWDVIERLPNPELWEKNNVTANYLVWDLETTGFHPAINRIQQFGFLYVKNGVAADYNVNSIFIKTPYSPQVYSAIYATNTDKRMQFMTHLRKAGCDLNTVKQAIDENDGSILGLEHLIPSEIIDMRAQNGKRYFIAPVDVTHIKSSKTMELGKDREEAINKIAHVMIKTCENKTPIVGHNIYRFDIPFLEYEAKHYCNIDLQIDRELVVDTGMIIKANQSRTSLNKTESLASFYERTSEKRSRAKWTLDDYCFEAFGLSKYGIDPNRQHDASYDCFVNHCLVKELAV